MLYVCSLPVEVVLGSQDQRRVSIEQLALFWSCENKPLEMQACACLCELSKR